MVQAKSNLSQNEGQILFFLRVITLTEVVILMCKIVQNFPIQMTYLKLDLND